MDQIKYQTGLFITFTATRTFALGETGVNVTKNSEFEFDGSIVKYAGTNYTFPQMRGAAKVGWIVPTENYEEGNLEYGRPQAANIKVRPTTDNGKQTDFRAPVSTETDERVVGNYRDHAKETVSRNGFSADVEPQDGVELPRTFKTAASSKTDLSSNSLGETMRSLNNLSIKPGKGRTEEDLLSSMGEDQREEYLAQKESIRSRILEQPVSRSRVVGRVKTAEVLETSGMKVTQKVGGGVDTSDGEGEEVATIGGDRTEVRTEDGITFRNTNGPRQKVKAQKAVVAAPKPILESTVQVRLQIAKSICPEFPASYDFSATTRKKLARLQADFEDRPDVLRAVFAAESDDFKATLIEEFPTAFQG